MTFSTKLYRTSIRAWAMFVCLVLSSSAVGAAEETAQRPNVVFIAIDDLNDWIGCLGGHPQAQTPNLDRLARRGTLFTSAHCQAPICNPSRTSLMLGKRPSTTGVYALSPNYRNVPWLRNAVTLPEYFEKNGYRTAIAGKIFHSGASRPYLPKTMSIEYGPTDLLGHQPPKKLVTTPQGNHPLVDWGTYPHQDEDRGDHKTAAWASKQIHDWKKDQPNFLAVGFFLPHVPLYAPSKWFEMYPKDTLTMPAIRRGDRDDTPEYSWYTHWIVPEPRLSWLQKNHQWENIVQAYLACTSYVDAQVGLVLDSIEAAGMSENTVVVLWSDHGWHLGEKGISGKKSLWEESTRVPLIFAGPNVAAGAKCTTPVELLDIYPTLLELCHMPEKGGLDGLSLGPQLRDASTVRSRPALTTHNQGNHAVRSARWRYIRYADGSQELYDHQKDPNEWHNLIGKSTSDDSEKIDYAAVIRDHARWLPQINVPPVPGSGGRLLVREGDDWMWEGKAIVPSEAIK